jgi:hypothetical protein
MITDRELEQFDGFMDHFWQAAYRVHAARIAKLNVAEMRVLLVHFKLAYDKSEAKSWSRGEMIDALAERFATDEEGIS